MKLLPRLSPSHKRKGGSVERQSNDEYLLNPSYMDWRRKMITLIIITTMSVITLWLATRTQVDYGFGEDEDEPAQKKLGSNERFASVSAWIATFLNRENIDSNSSFDPFAPPPERYPDAASYCPKCRDQFRKGFTQCNTCEIALADFSIATDFNSQDQNDNQSKVQ